MTLGFPVNSDFFDMFILKIAIRNAIARKSSIAIVLFIAIACSLLIVTNAIFDGTEQGVQKAFINSFTGDFVISPKMDIPLSLFGDDTPITGELSEVNTLTQYSEIKKTIDNLPFVHKTASQISGIAMLDVLGFRTTTAFFGINAPDYISLMEGITIIEGDIFFNGTKGIMLPLSKVMSIQESTGKKIQIGDMIQLSIADGTNFRIRSLPLTGIYSYSIENQILDRIVLIDADTARALMDITDTVEIAFTPDDSATAMISDSSEIASIDDFFYQATDISAESYESDYLLTLTSEQSENENQISDSNNLNIVNQSGESTSWNFIIGTVKDGYSSTQCIRKLNKLFEKNDWPVKAINWRTAAGSTSQYLYLLRIILNFGIIAILFTGFIVVMNSLVINVLDRIREIGTLQAIGAGDKFVLLLFLTETLLITGISGIVGCFLGYLLNQLLISFNISFSNTFLIQLFGSNKLAPVVTFSNMFKVFILALLLGFIGWFYSARIAIKTSPIEAMRGVN